MRRRYRKAFSKRAFENVRRGMQPEDAADEAALFVRRQALEDGQDRGERWLQFLERLFRLIFQFISMFDEEDRNELEELRQAA